MVNLLLKFDKIFAKIANLNQGIIKVKVQQL